ncbi:MAG: hypothetical protein GY705_02220 [Bacteroidetes bacterium]|nr:hypothetical protein [Bacteroidota bacterium]
MTNNQYMFLYLLVSNKKNHEENGFNSADFSNCHLLCFAGGIVTNTNQSTAWVRTLVRDASVGVDAVFYNPAGLTHLEDGFYVQINNQSLLQTRTITNNYANLNNGTYEGTTDVLVLPTAFLVYKTGNLAISGGFTVIGGGGSVEFDNGLPSFEKDMSDLTPGLASLVPVGQAAGVDLSVSGYDADIYFKGSSVYLGFQAGVSYKINDMLSVAAGGRYVSASNTYTGHIKNITFQTGAAGTMRADAFLNTMAIPTVNGTADNLTQITQIPVLLQSYINTIGGYTLEQAQAGGFPADQAASISAAVTALGFDPSTMTIAEISGTITAATPGLNEQIGQLQGTSAFLGATSAVLGDKEVDVYFMRLR